MEQVRIEAASSGPGEPHLQALPVTSPKFRSRLLCEFKCSERLYRVTMRQFRSSMAVGCVILRLGAGPGRCGWTRAWHAGRRDSFALIASSSPPVPLGRARPWPSGIRTRRTAIKSTWSHRKPSNSNRPAEPGRTDLPTLDINGPDDGTPSNHRPPKRRSTPGAGWRS